MYRLGCWDGPRHGQPVRVTGLLPASHETERQRHAHYSCVGRSRLGQNFEVQGFGQSPQSSPARPEHPPAPALAKIAVRRHKAPHLRPDRAAQSNHVPSDLGR